MFPSYEVLKYHHGHTCDYGTLFASGLPLLTSNVANIAFSGLCTFRGSSCITLLSNTPFSVKNKPLNRSPKHWNDEHPLTESQLKQRRDEFWETAPMFGGHTEIWSALKLVAEFVEKNDYDMAQAILDGADILLPTGELSDCYDSLGTRYQLPAYVFSEPSNLIRPVPVTQLDSTQPVTESSAADNGVASSHSANPSPLGDLTSANVGDAACSPKGDNKSCESSDPSSLPFSLRIRLSTGQDIALKLPSDEVSVSAAKQRLAMVSPWPVNSQRWFICGRALRDSMRIRDCEIPEGFTVQVFVYLRPEASSK